MNKIHPNDADKIDINVFDAVDFEGEAIQVSYRNNTFKPMSFEIVPFLILWLYAIYSSWK